MAQVKPEGARETWRSAHQSLVRLAADRAGLDSEEGGALLRAWRTGVHVHLGYGSFAEYAERLFGYSPRLTHEKLRVAEALEGLPELAQALRKGETSFSAVRELTRVATPNTEREWLAAARSRTVRDVEELVSGHRPGSLPDDVPEAKLRRRVIRLEVSGETLATFREAMAKIRRDAGGPLDDDAAVLLLARHLLEGPRDEGRASYQVALTVCERCRTGKMHGRGELVDVGREVVETAECDAQHLGNVSPTPASGAECTTGADGSDGDAGTAPADPHVGTGDDVGTTSPPRATQEIPPAIRRSVLRRDQHRCRAPGCRHATFLDVHHLVARAEGGLHEAENLVALCSAHHRAIHEGTLVVEGSPAAGLRFLHADGSPYGARPEPAGARERVLLALADLGYSKREAEELVDKAETSRTETSIDAAALLRRALQAA